MLLNRNSNASNSGKSGWAIYLAIILVLVITIFGAKEKIRSELQKFLSMPDQSAQKSNKEEIETIVYDFIKNNPDVIISSLKDMQKREYEESLKQAKITIQEKKDQIQGKDSGIALIAGNKDGDITIVTFLDYRCGYCKKGNSELKEVIKKDPKIKVIFKEYPVLGGMSQKLAKTALAVYLVNPSKYMDFHNALMEARDPNDSFVQNTLKMLNVDHIKVKEAMNDPRVEKELSSVADLAQQLNVRGTPAFIIGEQLIPGAIDSKAMLELVKAARENPEEKK